MRGLKYISAHTLQLQHCRIPREICGQRVSRTSVLCITKCSHSSRDAWIKGTASIRAIIDFCVASLTGCVDKRQQTPGTTVQWYRRIPRGMRGLKVYFLGNPAKYWSRIPTWDAWIIANVRMRSEHHFAGGFALENRVCIV